MFVFVFLARDFCNLLRFVLAMVGYGLGFAVTGFAGNLYLNIFLMNVVSIPGKLCSFFFTNR